MPSPLWGSYVSSGAAPAPFVGRYTDVEPARPRRSREYAAAVTGAVALPST
ncbi:MULTISPECIES: hypothetical protein [Rathayibacter]|uniref:hypothetical protein n=1 Tax=Rathayibacter TaxID=33886 RepID=UPI0012F978A3|nr:MULTISPECIES: hypothetical protein [Rathayibacter]MCJ1696772.1 hypothetical protein [Rathayibacter caricis]